MLFPRLVSFAYVTVAVFETVGKASALTLTERLRIVAAPEANGFGLTQVTVCPDTVQLQPPPDAPMNPRLLGSVSVSVIGASVANGPMLETFST